MPPSSPSHHLAHSTPPTAPGVPAWPATGGAPRVLLLGSDPGALAALHDLLEEAGYAVRAEPLAAAALSPLRTAPPELLLLEARQAEPVALELVRALRADAGAARRCVVFMLEQADAARQREAYAAGADHVGRPAGPQELLARIAALLRGGPNQQARTALDAFGHASLAVRERDGRCIWHTALARALMAGYFTGGHFERGRLPPELTLWLHREALRRRAGADPADLTVLPQAGRERPDDAVAQAARSARRLSFTLHAGDADALGEGHWLIVMREADDTALLDALIHRLRLAAPEAELLYWLVRGHSEDEVALMLGLGPARMPGRLAGLLSALGVRSAEQAVARARREVGALAEPH